MKRTFKNAKTIALQIVNIKQSNQYADRYFAFTDKKGTDIDPYLTQNNGKGQFADNGIFILNKAYLQSLAEQLGITLQSLLNRINSDSNNMITFDVEQRVVGQTVHNDDGTVALDRNGDEIVYHGDSRTTDEGAEYCVVVNQTIEVSQAVKDRLLDLDDKADIAFRLAQATEDKRVKLVAPTRTARRNVIHETPKEEFDPSSVKRKKNESDASYNDRVEQARESWIALHENG